MRHCGLNKANRFEPIFSGQCERLYGGTSHMHAGCTNQLFADGLRQFGNAPEPFHRPHCDFLTDKGEVAVALLNIVVLYIFVRPRAVGRRIFCEGTAFDGSEAQVKNTLLVGFDLNLGRFGANGGLYLVRSLLGGLGEVEGSVFPISSVVVEGTGDERHLYATKVLIVALRFVGPSTGGECK